jgi:hypothetical protein
METKMFKLVPLAALVFLSSSFAMPTVAKANPPTNTADNLAACRALIAEDPNIHLGGCLGFVQTIYTSHDHGWIPHYCAGLRYYEPEVFDALYDSLADCIIANQGNPPF